jgi:hypothetical protein
MRQPTQKFSPIMVSRSELGLCLCQPLGEGADLGVSLGKLAATAVSIFDQSAASPMPRPTYVDHLLRVVMYIHIRSAGRTFFSHGGSLLVGIDRLLHISINAL